MIAEDWGDSDVFKKAIVAMSEITDEFVFHVGLVGDYGALAVRLIKAFDAGGVLRASSRETHQRAENSDIAEEGSTTSWRHRPWIISISHGLKCI